MQRFPASVDELFERLERRQLEPDLREQLRGRLQREHRPIARLRPADAVEAVCRRLLPSAAVPPRALAAFLDDVFDQQKGRGDEKVGVMDRTRLIPIGFEVLDSTARRDHGLPYADVDAAHQDELLSRCELGEVGGPEEFDAATWFKRVRELVLLGYGSDPRGMVEMGFPGPSYRTGHVWLSEQAVRARAERKPGFLEL